MNKPTALHRLLVWLTLFALALSACSIAPTEAPTLTPAPTPSGGEPTAVPTQPPPTEPPAPTDVPPTEPPAEPTATTEPEVDKYGGTLIVTYSQEPTSFDPPKAFSTMDWGTVAQLLYNGLYVFDAENNLVPDLAADLPEISEDGLVYTIPLKEGVLFHNGRELVADDVKYSIERNAMPNSGSWNATQPMQNVVGGQAIIDGTAETADGIVVVDDHTVEFTLVEPNAYFLHSLTLVTNFIVPSEVVEEWGEDFSFHPVGTGPFMMSEWTPGERVVFDRNPDYFIEGLPYLDGIVYELGAEPAVSLLRFEQGEVDVIADGVPSAEVARVATDPNLQTLFLNTKTYLTAFIGFNNETEPFDDPLVRRAIGMAIDRDRLIQLGSNTGAAADVWYPPSHYNCTGNAGAYPYDPEAARDLLEQAGYPDGFDTTGWFRTVRPWLDRIPEAVQQDLAAIGVNVELLQLESAVATEMLNNGELPIFIQAWGASFPDPFNFATELFASTSTYGKRWRYNNAEVDTLVAQARQDTNPDSRCETWLQVESLVLEDTPASPLFVAGYPDLQSPRIQDFAYHDTYHRPRYEQIWIAPEDR
jgi:peptide/nickel transport system substrate-binding protein